MKPSGIIALITDFGTSDTYVGEMKGAILSRWRNASIVDVTHEIPAGDIRAAAFALVASRESFPRGTVHLCVVDPAVGSAQKRLAVSAGGRYYVGPDNGLFSPALEGQSAVRARVLEVRDAAATFHGRDVFAPAAAHLAGGGGFARLGKPVKKLAGLALPSPRRSAGGFSCEVIHVDHFGNLITNLRPEELASGNCAASVGRRKIKGLAATYADVPPGELLVLVGSHGYVEIAARGASAVKILRTGRGGKVLVKDV